MKNLDFFITGYTKNLNSCDDIDNLIKKYVNQLIFTEKMNKVHDMISCTGYEKFPLEYNIGMCSRVLIPLKRKKDGSPHI